MTTLRFGPRPAFVLALAIVYGLILHYGLPGHLSTDSLLSLREGRFGVRNTFNPAIFSWILGVFDRIWRGTGLYVATVAALLVLSWGAMAWLRPKTAWTAPLVVLLAAATPQVLIYPAIVWKDVAFAVSAIAGFVLLALGAKPGRARWAWLLAAALLFAAASLFRQNGLIAPAFAAVALGWMRLDLGRRRAAVLALGWAAVVAALTLTLDWAARPQGAGAPEKAGAIGIRILEGYDLIGAEALSPGRPLPHIDGVDRKAGDYIRWAARRAWSPERVDQMAVDPQLGKTLYGLPEEAVRADWLDLVMHDPGLYLKVRLADFRWVLATPVIDRCLPVHLGVAGDPVAMADLKIPHRVDRRDARLFNYVTWVVDSPLMSHLAWLAAALALTAVLLVRRGPGDIAIAALMVSAVGFAASFLPVSLACDYRYLYFLDLATITGAIWFGLDPTFSRRAAPRPAPS